MKNQTPKPSVIARLSIEYKSGRREAIEIQAGATFHAFYSCYLYTSKRKKVIQSTQNRNYHNNPAYASAGLVGVEKIVRSSWKAQQDPVTSTSIKIYKKRLYKKMLTCAPDQLGSGLALASIQNIPHDKDFSSQRRATPGELLRIEARHKRKPFASVFSTRQPLSKPATSQADHPITEKVNQQADESS